MAFRDVVVDGGVEEESDDDRGGEMGANACEMVGAMTARIV